ncbi:MAG TPA: BamA/TamA family outer membrane protein [Polyangia bacterium]|nr:BamA/TamA family outer membrane protein [Polyangia bacterium]
MAALAVAALVSRPGRAQEVDAGVPPDAASTCDGCGSQAPPGPPVELAAAPAPAPPPDQASGVLVPEPAGASALLWVPRVVLFIPRWLLEIPMAPFRLGTWAFDRYQLPVRFRQWFFNDAGTFGVYPLFLFETGFGFNAGLRLVHTDLLGHGEQIKLSASFGGEVAQRYAIKLASGRLLGDRVNVQVRANVQIVPKGNFFGIGNGALQPVSYMGPLIDALHDPTAVPTRFGQTYIWESALVDGLVTRYLHAQVALASLYRTFSTTDVDLGDHEYRLMPTVYDPATLIGFGRGLSSLYAEGALIIDTLRAANPYVSVASPVGWKVTAYGGYTGGFGDDPSSYLRYGLDALRYFDIYGGDRILLLRLYLEGVTGPLDRIPFTDLPRLGGPMFLRGYPRDRFRDRGLWLGTAEYEYPVTQEIGAYLFLDAGRVEHDLGDPSFSNVHYGIGGGIELHTATSFILRVQLAGSLDEPGLFVKLTLDPIYTHKPRATEVLSW